MSHTKPQKHKGDTNHDPSLCWDCANATRPWRCCWVRDNRPYPGWLAKKTLVSKKSVPYESYHVLICPGFVRDSYLGGLMCDTEANHKVTIDDDDTMQLAEAIVERAVEDWIALHYGDIPKLSKCDGSAVNRKEVVEFFYSDWCKELMESFTDYTPNNLQIYLGMKKYGERYGLV